MLKRTAILLLLAACICFASCTEQADIAQTTAVTTAVEIASADISHAETTEAVVTTAKAPASDEPAVPEFDINGDGRADTYSITEVLGGTQYAYEEISVTDSSGKAVYVQSPDAFIFEHVFSFAGETAKYVSYNGYVHSFEKAKLNAALTGSSGNVDYTAEDGRLSAAVSITYGGIRCGEWKFHYAYRDGMLMIDHVYVKDYSSGATVDFGSTEPQIRSDYGAYYFDQRRRDYSGLDAKEISASDFAAFENARKVYIEKYPAFHGGLLYDTGDEYKAQSLANLNAFLGIIGVPTADLSDVEIGYGIMQYSGELDINVTPENIITHIYDADMSDIDKVMANGTVQAMLEHCGIDRPYITASEDTGIAVYTTIYQAHGDGYTEEIDGYECSVTVEYYPENKSTLLFARKAERVAVEYGFTNVDTAQILADINETYSGVTSFKYEEIYSDVDIFGYSIPCYKIYIPFTDDTFVVEFYRACTASSSDLVIDVSADELYDTMERIEESESFPSDVYSINLLGFSMPVNLTMQLDSVVAVSACGQTVVLTEPRDIYGNCSFNILEYDGAIILEGGYYGIGDIYVLSPSGTDEVHRGDDASYYLHLNEEGRLYYRLTHNGIATISQTGALSMAKGYDEFWYAEGYASIEDGGLIFAEPYESHKLAEKYDFEKEFEQIYSQHYDSIEEVFEANKNRD